MVCGSYSAVCKMVDCYSEGKGFELVSGTYAFVDMKISIQHHAIRVGLCSRVCVFVWGMKTGNYFLFVSILLSIGLVFSFFTISNL